MHSVCEKKKLACNLSIDAKKENQGKDKLSCLQLTNQMKWQKAL